MAQIFLPIDLKVELGYVKTGGNTGVHWIWTKELMNSVND